MSTTLGDDLTVSQAARELNLSVSRIKQLTDSGQLACRRTPLGRIISRAAVENLAAGRGTRTKGRTMSGDLTDEQLISFARARIGNDLEVLRKGGAIGEAKVDVDRGVVLITNADQCRTWAAAAGVLDSGDQSANLN